MRVLDVHDVIVITDFFVICSAGTEAANSTVIDAVEASLRGLGVKPLPILERVSSEAGWWCCDYVDVVVPCSGKRSVPTTTWNGGSAPRVEWEQTRRGGLLGWVESSRRGP